MGPDESPNTTPPVEPVRQPVETPPTPVPAPQQMPPTPASMVSDQPAPYLPVKKSKKGLLIGLILGGIVVLGLATAGIVYAVVYNNPENAVLDAFSKALTAKSGSVDGSVMMKSQASSVKLNLTAAANEAKQMSSDVTVTVTTSGDDYTIKGHLAGTNDEAYIKVEDVRSLLTQMLGSQYSSAVDEYYGDLLDKIDGKWVVIKQSDLEELSSGSVSNKESQCVQSEIGKLQTDPSLRNEVVNTYKEHPLFLVESKGSDKDGNRYSLTPVSNAEAKEFFKAVIETKFFKALDDCTEADMKQSLTDAFDSESESSSDKATISFEIWVNGWTHYLNKVSLNIKDESSEVTANFNTKFNNNPTVTLPKAETTVDDLKDEIKKIQQQTLSGYESATPSLYDYTY